MATVGSDRATSSRPARSRSRGQRSNRLHIVVATALVLAFVVVMPGAAPAATTHNVPGDFATIQAAIDAAVSGDTIQIEAGTYLETLNTKGKDLTIEDAGSGEVVITSAAGRGITVDQGGTVFLSDLSIKGGRHGVLVENGSVTMERLLVEQNEYEGIHVEGTSAVGHVVDSVIRNNTSCRGGIYMTNAGGGSVVRSTITENFKLSGADCSFSAAVYARASTPVDVIDNTITDNASYVGGISVTTPGAVIEGNYVARNEGLRTGGIEMDGTGPLTIRNNVVVENHSTHAQETGGIWVAGNEAQVLSHNTVAFNSNAVGGSQLRISRFGNPATVIANNIIVTDGDGAVVTCVAPAPAQTPTFESNVVWTSGGDLVGPNCAWPVGIEGESQLDPLFANPLADDYSLAFGSPAIDAAHPAYAAADDIDDVARPTDGDGDTVAAADVGAYEFDLGGQFVFGTVTSDLGGAPVPAACVRLFDGDGAMVASTFTSANGQYAVGHDPGSYRIKVADCTARFHKVGWFGGTTLGTATPVLLTQTGAQADFQLGLNANCNGLVPTMIGTVGDDHLIGTPGPDIIAGGIGNDVIQGLQGGDILCGGKGNDVLTGGGGHDTLIGGDNNDQISGGFGNDILLGGLGSDRFEGGLGNDDITGGPGPDFIEFDQALAGVEVRLPSSTATGEGTDTLSSIENVIGSPFGDLIIGNNVANIIKGGNGDDEIHGGGGDDTINGGFGDDLIGGGPGDDDLDGGKASAGVDTATFQRSGNPILLDVNAADGLAEGNGDDRLFGFRVYIGSPHDDTIDVRSFGFLHAIIGGTGDDAITAQGQFIGAALLDGSGGNDTISGTESTMVRGGPGNDTLAGFSQKGTFGDGGNDMITGRFLLVGGPGGDHIQGESSPDVILGGEGADWLFGGFGEDNIQGGPGLDHLEGEGSDDVLDGGGGNDWVNGGPGDDLLFGGFGNDILKGSGNNDTLVGEGGNDQLFGGDHDDILSGGAGDDEIRGGADLDWVTYELSPHPVIVDLAAKTGTGNGTDLIIGAEFAFGSGFNDTLSGTGFDDLLVGWDGDDSLNGRGGDDLLDGMDGTDSLNGQSGDDTCYNGESHSGCETIDVFSPDLGMLDRRGFIARFLVY